MSRRKQQPARRKQPANDPENNTGITDIIEKATDSLKKGGGKNVGKNIGIGALISIILTAVLGGNYLGTKTATSEEIQKVAPQPKVIENMTNKMESLDSNISNMARDFAVLRENFVNEKSAREQKFQQIEAKFEDHQKQLDRVASLIDKVRDDVAAKKEVEKLREDMNALQLELAKLKSGK